MSRLSVEPWAAAVDLLEWEQADNEWRETSPDLFDPDACCPCCEPSDPGDRAW